MKRFEGKNVVITGSSRGIGLAILKLFAQEGANIAQTVGMVKRWKINKDFGPCLIGQFNCWNHVTICRNYYGNITTMFVCVINNLCGDPDI